MTPYIITFALIGLIIILILIPIIKKDMAKEKAHKEFVKNPFANTTGFQSERNIITYKKAFGVDTKNRKFAFRDSSGKITIIAFEDVMKCELYINEDKTIEKSSMRTIGGALVGGAAAGGIGAIIGGLSGGGKIKNELKYLCVAVYTKDILNPIYKHECVDLEDSLMKVMFPEMVIQTAKEIIAIISTAIDSCDKNHY